MCSRRVHVHLCQPASVSSNLHRTVTANTSTVGCPGTCHAGRRRGRGVTQTKGVACAVYQPVESGSIRFAGARQVRQGRQIVQQHIGLTLRSNARPLNGFSAACWTWMPKITPAGMAASSMPGGTRMSRPAVGGFSRSGEPPGLRPIGQPLTLSRPHQPVPTPAQGRSRCTPTSRRAHMIEKAGRYSALFRL